MNMLGGFGSNARGIYRDHKIFLVKSLCTHLFVIAVSEKANCVVVFLLRKLTVKQYKHNMSHIKYIFKLTNRPP